MPPHQAGFAEAIPDTPEEVLGPVPEKALVLQAFGDIIADTPSVKTFATQTVSLHTLLRKDCRVKFAVQTCSRSAHCLLLLQLKRA